MTRLSDSMLSRRRLLTGATVTTLAGIAATMADSPARAKAPMSNTQAPAYYRFRLGGFEATVISDRDRNYEDFRE